MRPKHVVSTKLALYSHDLNSVLIMHYPMRDIFGLPGGHVEAKENPNDTIRRELLEELSLSVENLQRSDFFLREGDHGPIILAFSAIAPLDVSITPTNPKFEYAIWVAKDDVANVKMSSEYKRFVLEKWPK